MVQSADDGEGSRTISGRKHSDSVSLGGAKADSPLPRDGQKYPVFEIGFKAFPRSV